MTYEKDWMYLTQKTTKSKKFLGCKQRGKVDVEKSYGKNQIGSEKKNNKKTSQSLVKQELNERNPIKTINTGVITLAVMSSLQSTQESPR